MKQSCVQEVPEGLRRGDGNLGAKRANGRGITGGANELSRNFTHRLVPKEL